jgi:predicted O-methyltransferase YrrM
MLAHALELQSVYLDSLAPVHVRVGHGQLGLNGSLGYEGKRVTVQQRSYVHALSSHAPARLLFNLGGRFASFECEVALNDDVKAGVSHADFIVLADGRQVVAATHVQSGQPPRPLSANVTGAQLLELVVETSRWEYCHAVWLDPHLEMTAGETAPSTLIDCLGRAEIMLPASPLRAQRCIATVVSPGFEPLVDDMLGSLYSNGECQGALLVLFALGNSIDCARIASKYKAVLIPCRSRARVNPMSKAILYSVARVAEADQYLCLDGDMLILGSLFPVFSALEACPEGSILAVREGNGHRLHNLDYALTNVYGGTHEDQQRFFGASEGAYSLVVNDGIFAGSRPGLLALDGAIRGIQGAASWIDQRHDIWWRNQFIFNLALAGLRCGVELDGSYNVQLHVQDVQMRRAPTGVEAEWHGRRVRVLHLSGAGRRKYPQWQGLYARVPDPMVEAGNGDAYRDFLSSLRGWVGRHGMSALTWSFYGTSDARSARVSDPGTFPLFGLLHYLVRSNGCARVLEAGTARGVSAACLASAVAHRADARVVTFDPYSHPERDELWAALPDAMGGCIESRAMGSLEGMADAHRRGERYDAALLDSIHTEEHVWAEFQLATQLVCPGGLILIHDARYIGGTVEQALQRIEAAGFGVTRLWTAECGVREDDGLGLAVIENRRRPGLGSNKG